MKAEDIKAIKQLSQEVVDSFPDHLTMDGKENLFSDGDSLHISSLLKMVEESREAAVNLNKVIQNIQSRKTSK